MKKSIFLILFFATIFGCEKDRYLPIGADLVGEWSWIKTCGGYSLACNTPVSTKHEYTIFFTTDSNFKTFLDDSLIASTRYKAYQTNSAQNEQVIWINVIEYESELQMFSISNDTLTLSYLYSEGASSYYKRVK